MGINPQLDDDLSYGAFSRVKRFIGPAATRIDNRATHDWKHRYDGPDDVETYCDACCCMDWHATADWPCGKPVREIAQRNRGAS